MKIEKNSKNYEKICKILFIVLSIIVLVISFFPFIKITDGQVTEEIGITYFLEVLEENTVDFGETIEVPFIYSLIFLIVTFGAFFAIIIFAILNILFNIHNLLYPSKRANRLFLSLNIMSYYILVFGTIFFSTGIGTSGEIDNKNYYSSQVLPIVYVAIGLTIIIPIIMYIVQKMLSEENKIEVSSSRVVRIISLIINFVILFLICGNMFSERGFIPYYSLLLSIDSKFNFKMIGFFGIIIFALLMTDIVFKIKNLTSYSNKTQVVMSGITIAMFAVFCLFLFVKIYIVNISSVLVPSWQVFVSFVLSIFKFILDNMIYNGLNE